MPPAIHEQALSPTRAAALQHLDGDTALGKLRRAGQARDARSDDRYDRTIQ
jgi:hypothetical protein